jgi:hypothetical protein
MATTCKLLLYRISGLSSPFPIDPAVTIREATGVVPGADMSTIATSSIDAAILDVADWLVDAPPDHDRLGLTLLLAEVEGQPTGLAELIKVQTILYRGLWIESLETSAQGVRQALVQRAVNEAQAAGLDEVGAMVPDHNWLLQQTLVAAGFRSLGEFHWLTADLPLPVPMQQDHV